MAGAQEGPPKHARMSLHGCALNAALPAQAMPFCSTEKEGSGRPARARACSDRSVSATVVWWDPHSAKISCPTRPSPQHQHNRYHNIPTCVRSWRWLCAVARAPMPIFWVEYGIESILTGKSNQSLSLHHTCSRCICLSAS